MGINHNTSTSNHSSSSSNNNNNNNSNNNRRKSWIITAINNTTATANTMLSSSFPSSLPLYHHHHATPSSSVSSQQHQQKQQLPPPPPPPPPPKVKKQPRLINDASEQLLRTLLQRWLMEFQIPAHPWSDILLNIVVQQVLTTLSSTTGTHADGSSAHHTAPLNPTTLATAAADDEDDDHEDTLASAQFFSSFSSPLWIQCIPTGKPEQSHFLPNIYEGVPLSTLLPHLQLLENGWHVGGTIKLQGISISSNHNINDLICVMLHVVGNMKLELNVLYDHHLTPPPLLDQQHQRRRSSHTNHNRQRNNINITNTNTTSRIPSISPVLPLPPPIPPLRRMIPNIPMPSLSFPTGTTSNSNNNNKPGNLIKWMFFRNKRNNNNKSRQSTIGQKQPPILFPSPTATANNSSTNVSLLNKTANYYASTLSSNSPSSLPSPPPRLARNLCNQLALTPISSSVGRVYPLPDVLLHLRDYEQEEQRKFESGEYNNNNNNPPFLQHTMHNTSYNNNNNHYLQRKTSSSIRLPSILSRSSSLRRHIMRNKEHQQYMGGYYARIHLLHLDRLLLLDIPRPSLNGFVQQQHLVFTYSFYPRSKKNQPKNMLINNHAPTNRYQQQRQQQNRRPCIGPALARMEFYRYHPDPALPIHRQFLDQSLGETILHMSQQSRKVCYDWVRQTRQNDPSSKYHRSRKRRRSSGVMALHHYHYHYKESKNYDNNDNDDMEEDDDDDDDDDENSSGGCELAMTDHTLCFAHGPSRVFIDMDTTTTIILPNATNKTFSNDTIMMWCVCDTCHAETKPIPMTNDTFRYSFAKYLEFMLYYDDNNTTTNSISPFSDFVISGEMTSCIHKQASSIIHCFYYDRCILRLRRDSQPLLKYTLCSPNISIPSSTTITTMATSPPTTNTTNTAKEADNNNNNNNNNNTTMDDNNQVVGHEIDVFFTAIIHHLELIGHYLKGEAKQHQLPASVKTNIETLQKELKVLQRTTHNDYSDWMLYVADNNNHHLNDVRRAFAIQAKLILNQINEWQRDRCPELIAECPWDMPDYFSPEKKVHAMPDSSILVREDEPTSIVAYTLNCTSYQTEIQQKSDTKSNKTLVDNSSILSVAVGGVVTDDEQPEPFVDNNDEDDNNDFYFSSLERYYFDDEENSSYHATTTTAASPSTSGGSSAALFVVTSFQQQQQHSPSFAYARQTLVQRVRQHHTHPHLGKLKTHWRTRFHHYHHTSTVPTRWKQFHGQVPSPLFNNNEEASGDASGGISSVSWDIQEERTIAQVDNNPAINEMIKELRLYNTIMTSSPHHRTVADESLINKNNTHTYSENKNLSPHIRHRFVHSNTEFTCIVYYAQEFEELRRRCGIEQMMIESLCRCQTWKTSGGKSKSRFYKTKDDRLVIKEMISSWNLAEKQQFLQFAPAYFDYMKRTTSEVPSVLTKIFGFFTIRITDNQKRATWAMDVMVMDHLFYNRTITQRFDFKGIRDRQVIIDRLQQHQQQQQHLTTLWDGDWIHGYQLVLNTTYYSKALIIDTALRNDAEFIEKCNIMDYSLLVGIDEQNREIIVGIVDFIGAYTWYKKIESKSKSTLKPQKQVTVLPPQQYRARFCREISTYFVPIPGKFDRIEPKEERNSFIASFCGFHMLK